MEGEEDIPTMLQLMFGEAAGTALRGASPRLLLWCRAFDEWLAERQRRFKPTIRKQALLAWRRLFRHSGKMPWELRPADIAQHAEWMRAEGLAPTTVYADLGILSIFYRWCAEKGADPECEPFFNPAASVTRQHARSYDRAKLLSRGEVEALLRTLRADRSPLGLREYAFILARLQLGVPLRQLQHLQWGQIRADETGAWVRWRPKAIPARLPEEAWEAIHTYLADCGRLACMGEESYIFAPLEDCTAPETGRKPEDWAGSYLSSNQILKNLKLYGRLAGIAEEKLNLETLRLTATRLRLEAGESVDGTSGEAASGEAASADGKSLEEMQAFLDSQSVPRLTEYRLRTLPALPQDPVDAGQEARREIVAPNRQPVRFQPGDGLVHGFFARSQPLEAVQAVLAENIQGLGEQVAGLRALGRGLLERQLDASSGAESARLGEMYMMVAGWLAETIRTEGQLAERSEEQTWAEEFLDVLVDIPLDPTAGPSPEGEVSREEIREAYLAEAMGGDPGLALTSRLLVEEIATLRYLLRNTLRVAAEAQETGEYVRMVDLYGSGSVRLARLLKREKSGQSRLAASMREMINKVVDEITADWAIVKNRPE